MRSAVEAAGDQSIPPSSSSLRWSSPVPSTLPPPPIPSTTKSPSPIAREFEETSESLSEQGPSGLEPGPSSSSPCETTSKSPPREPMGTPTNASDSARETSNDLFNEGDDSQPSTSRAHLDFVDNAVPMKLLKPKLEPLDEESSRDGFTPLDTLTNIKTEGGLGRLSEMPSEDSRSEVSNVGTKRYRVSFKVCSKAAARLKRILNAQPMSLKRLGIAGVQVDPMGEMVSVAARAKERAVEDSSRRGRVPTPAIPSAPLSAQPLMRGAPDRNGDSTIMAAGMGTQPGFSVQSGHPAMHPSHMSTPPAHVNVQHSQMGDVASGSGGAPTGSMPPSALPPHMQPQRQPQPPPTNSPILVNLLNSQQPPPPVGGRPFSPFPPGYPGPSGSTAIAPSVQQSGQPMDMAAYHQQMQERQRMMIQQQQQQQHQQQMQQQSVSTPTTPGAGPGPSGYGYPQRPMYPAQQQPGMYPPGHPNAQQRVPFPGQPAMYGAMPQVKQEPITVGYGGMPQVKQEPVDPVPPPAKKRKKPTKKQLKDAEIAAQAAAAAASAQPGTYFPDGRLMHPQQMQAGMSGGVAGGAPPHAQYPQGTGGPPPGIAPPHYYQQQQQSQQIAWQQQMQHQRMMQQQQVQQQQQMGMAPEYPAGTHSAPGGPSSAPWLTNQRPPPVQYPSGQNDSLGGAGVTGTGDMGSHSDSNSPVTPFGVHPVTNQSQQQPGHPSPMYSRESGGGTPTPTLFPYPSTSHGGTAGPGPSSTSGQSGLNSTPLTPGTTPQTPGGHPMQHSQQSQPSLSNDHHDFDDKLLGGEDIMGDLDDIMPMGGDFLMGREGPTDGEGRIKEEQEAENGEGTGGDGSPQFKSNGRHDDDREKNITSVVDMVAKGGGELSSPTPPSTATPTGTGNGGNGASAFPLTTPTPNTSSTAPPTPTQQTPPTSVVRRKNTASSVQQLTVHQRIQQQQIMMGVGGQPQQFGMPPGGVIPQGVMSPMHGHPHGGGMSRGPQQGHHIPHYMPHQQQPTNVHSGHSMEHHPRQLPHSYHPSGRGGGAAGRGGGRMGGPTENGRINGHSEMSNGSSSRDERRRDDDNLDNSIQDILSIVRSQGKQEKQAKEQRNTGVKSRGGGAGGGGTRKKRKANDIAKSPKEEEDAFISGMDGMTAGQAVKARMAVQGGQGGAMPQSHPSLPPSHHSPYYHHPLPHQNMRSQPPPVQHKPA